MIPTRYVCINCWHHWIPRKESAERRKCSACDGGDVVKFEELCRAVERVAGWIESRRPLSEEFEGFINLRETIETLEEVRRITEKTRFPVGSRALRKIVRWSLEYNRKREPPPVDEFVFGKISEEGP